MSENNTRENCGTEKRHVSNGTAKKEANARLLRRLKPRILKFETIIEQLNEAVHKLGNSDISAEELDDEENNFARMQALELKVLKARQILHTLYRRQRRLDGSLSRGEASTYNEYKVKRPIEHSVQFVGSGYDQIDCALTRFVNRQRARHFDPKTSLNFMKSQYNFPSCPEVLSIVKKENERYMLRMTNEEAEALSKRLCNDVIALLKRRTVAERKQVVQDMHIDSDDEKSADPAINDETLNNKLAENRRQAVINSRKALENLCFQTKDFTLPELLRREGYGMTPETMLSCCVADDGSGKRASDISDSVETSNVSQGPQESSEIRVQSVEVRCSDDNIDLTENAAFAGTSRDIEVIDLLGDSDIEIIEPDDIE